MNAPIGERLAPEAALALIGDILWREDDPPRINPDKDWSPAADFLDAIANVMRRAGYWPDAGPCPYPGCLGTAAGEDCRHPRPEDEEDTVQP